ncbi:MAG: response regulator [bacterium]|nr:response regulator [bacterium]
MKNKENKKPTVLIVDDDKQVLRSLQIWFKNEGFEPVVASTGDEALKALKKDAVDVAMVDLRMSREDGIEVSEKLREADEYLKIVIMTGFPSYETAVKAMKVGVFDYISKGSSNEKIMAVIRKAAEERKREKQERAQKTSAKPSITFILFCNHSLIKERLENFSKSNPEFKLVKSFPTVSSFKAKSITQEIDVALVCAGCNIKSISDSYNVFPELYRNYPGIKTVVINETFTDNEKVELLKLGIRGFSSKNLSSEKLEKALRQVKKGEMWVSRTVTNLSLKDMANFETGQVVSEKNVFGLTEREIEILRTMALGLKNKAIAQKLFISEKTVKTHINRIFKKLGVANRTRAILTAIENKILK